MRKLTKILWIFAIICFFGLHSADFSAHAVTPEEDTEGSSAAVDVQIPSEGENCETLSTPASSGLVLSASSAVLMDADSGRVLYAYNAQAESLIASITKIMTGLLTLETCQDLDEVVTACGDCIGVEGSSMYLEEGDQVSVRCLLYGLMLQSGNDAAVALAEHCAGSVDVFVTWMNDYAQKLGMTHTSFANPHGLNADGHYSTAEDMAILMREAMKNQTFREIVSTRHIAIDGFEFYNHNKLLDRYEYCIGGKTGYTELAGRTLVSAAEKDGQTLIAVTFNAPDDWNDHIAMFEYGFSNYPTTKLCARGEIFTWLPVEGSEEKIPVYCSRGMQYLLANSDELAQQIYLPERISVSVAEGAIIGKVVFYVNGAAIGETFLEAGASVTVSDEEGTAIQWSSDCKSFSPLAAYFPAAPQSGTYSRDVSLWMASSHRWA